MTSIPKGKILRAALSMGGFTTVSRILGMVREMVRAYLLGTGAGSDAFGIAFMIPNLLRRIVGEGAISAGFIPIYSEYSTKEDKGDAWRFASLFFNLMFLLLFALSLLGVLFAPFLVKNIFARGFVRDPERLQLTISLLRWTFFYLLFIGLSAIAQGILNSFRVFWVSAFTPILLNISIISLALLLHRFFSNPAYAFALGVIVGGALQFLFHLPFLKRIGYRYEAGLSLKHQGVRKTLKLLIPVIIGNGIYPINVMITELIATFLKGGAVSALQYSGRLTELVLGIVSVSISTVALPYLSIQEANGDTEGQRETASFSLRIIAFVTLPASVGLLLLREPIIRMIYGHGAFNEESVMLTSSALFFHSLGILFIAGQRNYSQVFYSKKDTLTPTIIAIVSAVLNIFFCLIFSFILNLSVGGIALASSLSSAVQFSLLVILLKRKMRWLKGGEIVSSLIKIGFSCAIMGVFIVTASKFLLPEGIQPGGFAYAVRVLTLLLLSILVYSASCSILRARELHEIMGMMKKRSE